MVGVEVKVGVAYIHDMYMTVVDEGKERNADSVSPKAAGNC